MAAARRIGTTVGRRAALLAGLGASCGLRTGLASAVEIFAPGREWITLLVAAPPGGPADTLARRFAADLGPLLGRTVVVDNRPGANGVIAAQALVHAKPDGRTVMLSWFGNVTSPTLLPRSSPDIDRDYTHITQLVGGANVLVSAGPYGHRTLAALLDVARSGQGRLAYASAGHGSSGHLAMAMLLQRAGVDLVHVPFSGGSTALRALLRGEVACLFLNQDVVASGAHRSDLRPLAVTSATRNARLPDVPTVAECGFPGFEATAWGGLSAPRGLPAGLVDELHAAARQVLAGPLGPEQASIGATVIGSTPAEYAAFLHRESRRWREIILKAGIGVH